MSMKLLTLETLQNLPSFLIPRLVDLFAKTTPALLDELQQHGIATPAPAAMAQAAHKLKGSCVSLGAEQMASICAELQHKGEQQDMQNVASLITELAQIFPPTLAELRKFA